MFHKCSTMTTFKAVVMKHHKKADGTFNVKIRVTQNRVKRYIATPYFVTAKDITRSFELKNQHYIDLCENIIRGYREKLEPYGMAIKVASADKIITILNNSDKDCILFSTLLDEYCRIRNISKNTRLSFENVHKQLQRFLNVEDVNICELTTALLQKWVLQLPAKSAELYAQKLKAIIAFGIKTRNDDENGVKPIPYNAMDKVEIPSVSHTDKKAITADEFRKFLSYEGSEAKNFARDMAFLSFCLVGMNLVDIYKLEKNDLDGDYLEYCRTKTTNQRDDNAFIRIQVQPEARELFKKCFGKMHSYEKMSLASAVNYNLNKIGEALGIGRIVFYSARHTWATLAVNDCEIDKYTVHLALNHVDTKTAITDVYIKKDFSPIDRANRKVIDYVLNKKGGQ